MNKKKIFIIFSGLPPSEIKGKRKIKAKVKRGGVKVFYAKERAGIEVHGVRIEDLRARNKAIESTIADFNMENFEEKMRGLIEVNITIYDGKSNIVFSKGKILTAFKKEVCINLKLNNLKKGNYFAIVEASDKISNSTDIISKEIKL